jgi:hypothetical protein
VDVAEGVHESILDVQKVIKDNRRNSQRKEPAKKRAQIVTLISGGVTGAEEPGARGVCT